MFATLLINIVLVAAVVMIHFEMLNRLSRHCPVLAPIKARHRVVISVFIALFAHVIEIWLFGLAYYWMIAEGSLGSLAGNYHHSIMDSVYYSFTSFTTLGFGDIEPTGAIRFVTGMEALTGLVLITWTASFIFIEMQRYWKDT
ncbi:MAG: Ion transporter [uncultured Thiotrichaceae bacterium]|uniref:Ion transporter n=1 Tax=uncultured Thiotrichaceae bacterium TaxID=298394 RepID=A0A6S6S6V0_9GAMM|nr:MAG: Ion transporter [uncultured Thiotrichaceae bacterium]